MRGQARYLPPTFVFSPAAFTINRRVGNDTDGGGTATVLVRWTGKIWKIEEFQMVNVGRRSGPEAARERWAVPVSRNSPEPCRAKAFGGVYRVEQIRSPASWSFLVLGDRVAHADDICPPMTDLAADPLGTLPGGPIRSMRRHFPFFLPVIFE